ncbi:hypothetical protein CPB83DRAFT_632152 [Crepidotus variabilis]|uniref:Uncharacterized protein n=1 Tax=Crepidotus variabilis TaxID=179855 RepID=A0A9P6EPK7_9AGAR|nr:hypothetical protein CPB83DRAFT_632152 [Crepidotus variabilis]
MYATESDPGSRDDGSYELTLDSLPGPGILTRSRARRNDNSPSIVTSGSIATSASISGASSQTPKSRVITPTPDLSRNSSQPPDEITRFLSRCRPNMEHLRPCFREFGIQSDEELDSIGKWSAEQRRSFFSRMHPENDGTLLTELHLTAIEYQFASRKNMCTGYKSVSTP